MKNGETSGGNMGDLEKGLDAKDEDVADVTSDSSKMSPTSTRASLDAQKTAHPNTVNTLEAPERTEKAPNSHANPQSVIVDWDGPDDPDFPQNMFVSVDYYVLNAINGSAS